MTLLLHVKTRLPRAAAAALLAMAFLAPGRLSAQGEPSADEILRIVRVAQSSREQVLNGRLRTGSKTVPFRLVITKGVVRWEFSEPPQSLILTLGEKSSRLEESSGSGAQRVSPARFDQTVRDTDISYEDLSLRFLYWPNATIEGEQTMVLQKCWIIRVEPPARNDSQYSQVKLWIAKDNGALMQAEAFGSDGKIARRFKVVSGQKTDDGLWILKQMRIESPAGSRRQDRTPTYLEIERPR